MLISEAFDLYKYEYMIYRVRSIRIKETHEQVRRTLIQTIGDRDVSTLSVADLQPWFDASCKNKSQNTLGLYVTRLRMVLEHLELKDIPCLKSRLIPQPKRVETIPEVLTPEEVSRMIDATPRLRNKFIISILYSSGIRLSEFLKLNRNSIYRGHFSVVGKGGKARICFIDARTKRLMNEYLLSRTDSCEALVVSYLHQARMTATNVEFIVKNTAKRAGITRHITPHTMRHSFTTDYLENDGNILDCKELLGHKRIETTMRYIHMSNKRLQEKYNKYHSF